MKNTKSDVKSLLFTALGLIVAYLIVINVLQAHTRVILDAIMRVL